MATTTHTIETNKPFTFRAKWAAVRPGKKYKCRDCAGKGCEVCWKTGKQLQLNLRTDDGQVFIPPRLVNDLVKIGVLTGETERGKTPWDDPEEKHTVVWEDDGLSPSFIITKEEGKNNRKFYTVEGGEAPTTATKEAVAAAKPTPHSSDTAIIKGVVNLYKYIGQMVEGLYEDEQATQACIATCMIQLAKLGIHGLETGNPCPVCGAPGGVCDGCKREADGEDYSKMPDALEEADDDLPFD